MRPLFRFAIVGVVIIFGATVQAAVLSVGGSPEYDSAGKTGFKDAAVAIAPGSSVNKNGTAIGYAEKYVNGNDLGDRAVRWDASGNTATELGNLGSDANGSTLTVAYAINDSGTVVGYAVKYVDGNKGYRAVRWDASGTSATELDSLGTRTDGLTFASAHAINDAGTAVGYANKYINGSNKGARAARWDASGTAVTELGNLGTDTSGYAETDAFAINNAGTAVGYARKYSNYTMLGARAVRWDASGTAATQLGNLGTDGSGYTDAAAYTVNDAGMVVGYASKYISGKFLGTRAVRWDASGTAATELDNLGTDISGYAYAKAYAVNDAGTAAGYADKYFYGVYQGTRAVRWNASGTAATELGNLGKDTSGSTRAVAFAINDVGTAVGYATKYIGGSSVGNHAVIWLPDASAIDLNDMGVVPVTGGGTWMLTEARGLSADGWVSGVGTFDPDSTGPLASYTRLWVAQVGLGGTWTTSSGGVWGLGLNWSTGTPAKQIGNAAFNLNAAYSVVLDRDELTKTIAINAGTVTLDLNGHTLATESGLSIAAGAKFKGTGSVLGDIFNAGALVCDNGSSLELDNIKGTGTLTLNGDAMLTVKTITQGTLVIGNDTILHASGEYAVKIPTVAVPEPSTSMLLALCGLALCGVYLRWK